MSTVSEGDLPLGPALEFLRGLWRLNHAVERVSSRMCRTLGITAQQRMVLRTVGRFPGMTAGQLAGQLHLDPGTVSTALRRLEQKKLLERRRDPRDRRRVTLGLTVAGRALDRPTDGTVERAVERLLRTADPDALRATSEVIEALAVLLEDEARGP